MNKLDTRDCSRESSGEDVQGIQSVYLCDSHGPTVGVFMRQSRVPHLL
jgi:hypothetical protein